MSSRAKCCLARRDPQDDLLAGQRLGLADRGLLREGVRADLVVFDLTRIKDRATYDDAIAAPAGIDEVIVNGVANVQPTGSRSGVVLRHSCPGV